MQLCEFQTRKPNPKTGFGSFQTRKTGFGKRGRFWQPYLRTILPSVWPHTACLHCLMTECIQVFDCKGRSHGQYYSLNITVLTNNEQVGLLYVVGAVWHMYVTPSTAGSMPLTTRLYWPEREYFGLVMAMLSRDGELYTMLEAVPDRPRDPASGARGAPERDGGTSRGCHVDGSSSAGHICCRRGGRNCGGGLGTACRQQHWTHPHNLP